jgi:hypothetical protein
VYILKRSAVGGFEKIHAFQAHSKLIYSVALNKVVSVLATVCYDEGKVKLWDVKQGQSLSD